jgi:hypothetical protein
MINWCEPFDRADAHLLKTDIPLAIDYFEGIGDIKTLYLNPMYLKPGKQHLDASFPDDVEVLEHAGCASWEVMAEVGPKTTRPEKPVTAVPQNAPDAFQEPRHVNVKVSRGRMTPAGKKRGADLHLAGSHGVSSYKKGQKPVKQGILL